MLSEQVFTDQRGVLLRIQSLPEVAMSELSPFERTGEKFQHSIDPVFHLTAKHGKHAVFSSCVCGITAL